MNMNMNVASMKPACITAPRDDAARQRLHGWQAAGQMLCFSYTRTVGGLVLSGRGRIATLSLRAGLTERRAASAQ